MLVTFYVLQLQKFASMMLELLNLMDKPPEEQRMFHDVPSKIDTSEDEITEPNSISEDSISYVSPLHTPEPLYYESEYSSVGNYSLSDGDVNMRC